MDFFQKGRKNYYYYYHVFIDIFLSNIIFQRQKEMHVARLYSKINATVILMKFLLGK